MKRLSMRATCIAIIVSLMIPAGLASMPARASAQATVASCIAAFTTSAATQAPGSVQEVLGVPVANVGRFLGDIFQGGSNNSLSLTNCVLRPLGQAIVIALIRNIGSSVVNWVNSGFEGKPLFVTDFGGTLLNAADQAIGGLIEGTELGFLCNDFSFQIRLQLALKYSRPFQDRVTCTLSQIGDNVNNFVENNGGAGWDNWLEITTRPTNNIYGAYLVADSELARRAFNAVDEKKDRIAIGQGFLDFETCEREETTEEVNKRLSTVQRGLGGEVTGGGTFQTTVIRTDSTGATSSVQNVTGSNTSIEKQCLQKRTSTPGRVIAGKLESVLGQGEIQSAVAQEIDQVIAATLNQIAQKAIQGVGGLLGLSKKRSSSGPSYIDRYRAQFYGGANPSGPSDISASSELDDYMIGNIAEAQSLFASEADPNIRDINEAANAGLAATTNQQSQQQAALVNTYAQTSATTNAALLKPATQSSGSNPGGAVDGVTQTNQYIKGSATYTDDANPWWEVDLGKDKKIKEVRIWKVADKDGAATLGSFRVVAKTAAGTAWTSASQNGGSNANPIIVPVNQTASIIRIEKTVSERSCSAGYQAYYADSTCYDPLELAEVQVMEVIESASTTGTSTASSAQSSGSTNQPSVPNDPNSPITVASQTGTARAGQPFGAEVGITSPANRSVGSIEVALESASGQATAFSSVFSQATLGLKQGGVTRNFEPGSSGGMTFTGVSTGPSYDTRLVLTGKLASLPEGASHTVRITAKGSDGTTLSVGTIKFTATSAQAISGGGGASSPVASYGSQGISGLSFDFSSQILRPIPIPTGF